MKKQPPLPNFSFRKAFFSQKMCIFAPIRDDQELEKVHSETTEAMKKEYTPPSMKVTKVESQQMLCQSVGGVTFGSRIDNDNYDYIGGISDGAWSTGSPD